MTGSRFNMSAMISLASVVVPLDGSFTSAASQLGAGSCEA